MSAKLLKSPSLKSGNDAEAGKFLTQKFEEAQHAKRQIISCGLAAWEFKTQLKQGEWGPWLAVHAPSLVRKDSKTQKPKADASLSSFMDMTRGVLATLGFTIEKYFKLISNSQQLGICRGGNLLMLPEGKVPEEIRPTRDKMCALVDGKTHRQLCLEFKQVELDEDSGQLKKKHGRLKGQGGASKEQRAASAQRDEQGRIEAVELDCEDIIKLIEKHCDAKGFGSINKSLRKKLAASLAMASGFIRHMEDGQ